MTKLVAAFGTSTPYAFWGFELVGYILNEWVGGFHRVHCLYVHELRSQWRARGERAVLVTSDRPDEELSKLLLNFDIPSIAFLDTPEDFVTWVMNDRTLPPKPALCFSTQFLCCLEPVLVGTKTIVFGSEWHMRSTMDFVQELVKAVTGVDGPDLARRVAEKNFPETMSLPVSAALNHYNAKWSAPLERIFELTNDFKRIMSNTLASYAPPFERKPIEVVNWPLELFFSANKDNARPDDIDLLGSARLLIWGPYCYLPMGKWRAHVEFEVVDCPPDVIIFADIYSGQSILSFRQGKLPSLGIFEYFLDFEVLSTQSSVEVRIGLTKGVIEGRFGLRSVRVYRLPNGEAAP